MAACSRWPRPEPSSRRICGRKSPGRLAWRVGRAGYRKRRFPRPRTTSEHADPRSDQSLKTGIFSRRRRRAHCCGTSRHTAAIPWQVYSGDTTSDPFMGSGQRPSSIDAVASMREKTRTLAPLRESLGLQDRLRSSVLSATKDIRGKNRFTKSPTAEERLQAER